MLEEYEQTMMNGFYTTVIKSEIPAFARFDDLIEIARGFAVGCLELENLMKSESFPQPINSYNYIEEQNNDVRKWGIWVYEEVSWAISDWSNKNHP